MDTTRKSAPRTIPIFGAEETARALEFRKLIPAIRDAFAVGAKVPLRHHHEMPQSDGTEATLLLMPAWQPNGGVIGVKIVTVFPGNTQRQIPGVHSTYLLCDGETGEHLAIIDGNQITGRRTVGVAALAASYLARDDAERLLIVGAGRIGSMAPFAYREVRHISDVKVWDVNRANSVRLVQALAADGMTASVADDLEEAVSNSDMISCATLSTEPLIKLEWMRPGTHLDLIGSFTPQMREADDACFATGSVYIDSPDALKESGDLISPIERGILQEKDILGTLSDLCSGAVPGRRSDDEITVFKAVGTGLSDLAAGALAYRELSKA
ncbi:ornithine cyclodeaminase [Ensifer sp. Root31]|uniref:ornithine cyclodeaminase family protein n=1 Tax=Ensifer sp. Root31 TaxID=1736512 RepID=UPI00070CB271|nr:ornithine cyclodeaminase family protein [Ensifer sp. Root31]KQU83899.1 ornithine cyclodeaminase [Ensifer sp. Root31]